MTERRIIVGRARIAHRLGVSERTLSRWVKRGIVRAEHVGPFRNNLLSVAANDIDRLRRKVRGA